MPNIVLWTFTTVSAALFAAFVALTCSNGACFAIWRNAQADLPLKNSPHALNGSWDVRYHLGGNGPWIPKLSATTHSDGIHPPPGCQVDQVHMISRHGERYPTWTTGLRMLELYHRMVESNITFEGPLAFFNTWNFFMPEPAERLEHLVPVGPYAGTLQSFETGVKLRTRYEDLHAMAKSRGQTRLWATDSVRIMDTASYFATGFYGLSWQHTAKLNIIPEDVDRGGDTLTPGRTCPIYRNETEPRGRNYGYRMLEQWQDTYLPPIRERLAPFAPGLNLTLLEVFTMQEMCGFELLARGESAWCSAFTHDEWLSFEYARDLLHYYRSGPGSPFGPALGWLFLNATTNLLLQEPEEATGPFFFSFVHDGDLIPFLAALDLFPQHYALSPRRRMDKRAWRTSDVTPMGGRVILERLACPLEPSCWSNAPFYPNHVYCDEGSTEYYVRINVNDGIIALPGCSDGPGASCPLEQFGEHVRTRGKDAGDFVKMCGLDEGAPDRITFLKQPRWEGRKEDDS